MMKKANEIRQRFIDELSNIENYFQFTELKLSSLESDVWELENILIRNNLFNEKLNPIYLNSSSPKSKTLNRRFKEIINGRSKIENRLKILLKKIDNFPYPEKLSTIDGRTELGELIFAFMDFLKSGKKNEKDLKKEYFEILKPQEENLTLHLFNIKSITNLETAINYSIESAKYLNLKKEYDDLEYLIDHLRYIDVMLKMSNDSENLSFIRQGFILLITVFDATVFDLIKVLLNDHFFKNIGRFSKEKISLESLKEYNDFDTLKLVLIDSSLSKKFLKETIFILKDLGLPLTKRKKDFPKLIELIMRRNIHVHNLGIVDERYLVKNSNDSENFNLYKFKIDDYATIDLDYWENAKDLCRFCVDSITNWIKENPT